MSIQNAHIRYYHRSGMRVGGIDGNVNVKTLPYLSVVEAVAGSYDIALGADRTYSTGAHGFFIAPAHVLQTITHRTDPATDRIDCRWIFLDLVLDEQFSPEELYALPTVLTGADAAPLHALFDRLFATKDRLLEYAAVFEILAYVLSKAQKKEHPKGASLAKSLRYIRENYASPIRISTLAALEHTSESNYHARFKKEMGISPVAYVNHFRLTLAAEALVNTKDSVASIGASVGIPDPLYFSKLFLRTYHTTPGQYRRRRG
jgi:AraC-like DNA-binding protein